MNQRKWNKSLYFLLGAMIYSSFGLGCNSIDEEELEYSNKTGKGDINTSTLEFTKSQAESTPLSPVDTIEVANASTLKGFSVRVEGDTKNGAQAVHFSVSVDGNEICKVYHVEGVGNHKKKTFEFACNNLEPRSASGTWKLHVGWAYIRTTQGGWTSPCGPLGQPTVVTPTFTPTKLTLTIEIESVPSDNPYNISEEAKSLQEQFQSAKEGGNGWLTQSSEVIEANKEWECLANEAKAGSNQPPSTVYMRFYPVEGNNRALGAKTFLTHISKQAPVSHDFQIVNGYLMGMIDGTTKRVFLKDTDPNKLLFEDILSNAKPSGRPISITNPDKVAVAYGICSKLPKVDRFISTVSNGSATGTASCTNLFSYEGKRAYGCGMGFSVDNESCRQSAEWTARDRAESACANARYGKPNSTSCSVSVTKNECQGTNTKATCTAKAEEIARKENQHVELTCVSGLEAKVTASWSFSYNTLIE